MGQSFTNCFNQWKYLIFVGISENLHVSTLFRVQIGTGFLADHLSVHQTIFKSKNPTKKAAVLLLRIYSKEVVREMANYALN